MGMSHTVSHAVISETLQSNIWLNHDSLGGSGQGGGEAERSHHVGDHVRGVYVWCLEDYNRLSVYW